jgi:GSH-dependent disulfide-bond oxidoreductase
VIDLHYWTTPNGHKITIFLEEAGLPYRIFPVNIDKGLQFKREFRAVSPDHRMPAIVDHRPAVRGGPLPVFESGAILLYLADKTKKFIAQDLRGRTDTIQWLFWEMGNLGPMSRQNSHFSNPAVEKLPYAMDRYRNEVRQSSISAADNFRSPAGSSARISQDEDRDVIGRAPSDAVDAPLCGVGFKATM